MPGWKKCGPTSRQSDYILCPFFRAHSDREVICEGHIPDSKTVNRFDSVSKKKQQQTIFCEGCYERCEHYQSVIHFKWEDEESR